VKIAESITTDSGSRPSFDLIRKLVDETQQTVSRRRASKLYRGNAIVVGSSSPLSLYSEKLATFEADTVYTNAMPKGLSSSMRCD